MMRLFILALFLSSTCIYGIAPRAAAIAFVEAMRDDEPSLDISQKCLLNSETGDLKKIIIYNLWQDWGKKMLDSPFSFVEERIENEHAIVILSQRLGKNSKKFQVRSVALIHNQGIWKPAPLLGSFENSVATFAQPELDTRSRLTQWMTQQEQKIRQELESQIHQQFLLAMREGMTPEQLTTAEVEAMMERFIKAVRERNPAAAISLLGGYTSSPSSELHSLHEHITNCLGNEKITEQWPWNLLTDPRTILVTAKPRELQAGTSMSIIAMHPDSPYPEPHVLHFNRLKDQNNIGFLVLPTIFTTAKVSEDHAQTLFDRSDAFLFDALKHYIAKKKQPQPISVYQTPLAYSKSLISCLVDNDFPTFWITALKEQILTEDDEFPDIPSLWQVLEPESSTSLYSLLACKQDGEYATTVLRYFSAANGSGIEYLWMQQKDQKWHLLEHEPEDAPNALLQWIADSEEVWKNLPISDLLQMTQHISGLSNNEIPLEEMRNSYDAWQNALKASDLHTLLPHCAVFDDEVSRTRMLKNLGGSLSFDSGKRTVLQWHTSGRWGAASTQLDLSIAEGSTQFPLDLFVATDAGPKLLPQIDLRLCPGNAARDLLNKQALRDLSKLVPEQAVDELKVILDEHNKLVTALLKNSQK